MMQSLRMTCDTSELGIPIHRDLLPYTARPGPPDRR
ncbi:hypothetical protein XCV3262 [Xanthomonas euvesicatoria pv. vesicatoria str. 85-10]|uniref:Uncharacterized protein n=1 Tax=Xanthomonas euvesicatoria pv. vesicatoria (strain 85-10) TaxID=316273 RepID=Q3BQH0_XANE5|nr:hypothetical protein XCV3262 [Xanthomonas euvesicatoria pv. vesicatoria str. 85-10]